MTRLRVLVLAAVVVAFGAAAAPAQAGFVHFTTPSGNIDCLGGTSSPVFVQCLVQRASWPHPRPRPANCDLEWTPTQLELVRRAVTVGSCHGDIGPLCLSGSPCRTLAYGSSVNINGIRCTSATTGVTCRYRGAPRVGFRIARQGYTVFRG